MLRQELSYDEGRKEMVSMPVRIRGEENGSVGLPYKHEYLRLMAKAYILKKPGSMSCTSDPSVGKAKTVSGTLGFACCPV